MLLLIVGSTDVDTAIITLGGLQPEAISPLLAAMAIAGTVIVNMAVKIGITLAYARAQGPVGGRSPWARACSRSR